MIHARTLSIEWGDCDPAGIVFYPRYFAMFDRSTTALFEHALGMLKRDFTVRYGIIGYPMVDTRASFLAPSVYGDVVTIESSVTAFRRSSFDVCHRLLNGGALAVEGFETRVWAGSDPEHPRGLKSVPIPAEVTEKFGVSR